MGELRATPDTAISDGGDPYLVPAVLRQPAGALGPRAHRTINRILDATREVFLARGYSGTTIDEIARLADVSRASFYTYFPSKREVLLAVGARTATETETLIVRLEQEGRTRAGLASWVGAYFELLDVHGSFTMAWAQAAHEDEEIRQAGMRRHLGLCRLLGHGLAATAGRVADEPALLGLVVSSTLERSWSYDRLYAGTIDREAVVEQVAQTLWGAARIRGFAASEGLGQEAPRETLG
jgi:TetR/AcrR family transcriptional regulator